MSPRPRPSLEPRRPLSYPLSAAEWAHHPERTPSMAAVGLLLALPTHRDLRHGAPGDPQGGRRLQEAAARWLAAADRWEADPGALLATPDLIVSLASAHRLHDTLRYPHLRKYVVAALQEARAESTQVVRTSDDTEREARWRVMGALRLSTRQLVAGTWADFAMPALLGQTLVAHADPATLWRYCAVWACEPRLADRLPLALAVLGAASPAVAAQCPERVLHALLAAPSGTVRSLALTTLVPHRVAEAVPASAPRMGVDVGVGEPSGQRPPRR